VARSTNARAGRNRVLAQTRVSALPDADSRFHSRASRNLLLCEAGVDLSTATTLDLATMAPDITAQSFCALFGGTTYRERPQSRERDILCINRDTQPYAPHSPGQSGLVFFLPGVALLEDTYENFHLFLNMNPKLSRSHGGRSEKQIRYIGTYTKVPIVHATVEPRERLSLPYTVSGIFQPFLPSALLVGLFLMAHCSVVAPGYVVFIL